MWQEEKRILGPGLTAEEHVVRFKDHVHGAHEREEHHGESGDGEDGTEPWPHASAPCEENDGRYAAGMVHEEYEEPPGGERFGNIWRDHGLEHGYHHPVVGHLVDELFTRETGQSRKIHTHR